MDKATDILMNQGVLGAVSVIFLTALILVGKMLLKEKDLRIKELQERLSDKQDERHDTFMDYLATVHTLVENSTRTVEKFAEIVAPLKAFLEMLINKKNL